MLTHSCPGQGVASSQQLLSTVT
eukprot:SAG31_NODE_17609_length_664_cov_1.548673_1_plen_22_part_10